MGMITYSRIVLKLLIVLPYPQFHFQWFQLPLVNHASKLLNRKLQKEQNYTFKCRSTLNNVTIPYAIVLHSAYNVNHPFVHVSILYMLSVT